MSKLLSILFILIIGVQTVHQGLIYAYYTINKDYIIQNFCKNKATPQLKCDGKCHLKKVLSISKKETAPQELPLPNLEKIKVPLLYYQAIPNPFIEVVDVVSIATVRSAFYPYVLAYAYQPVIAIFHPPQYYS